MGGHLESALVKFRRDGAQFPLDPSSGSANASFRVVLAASGVAGPEGNHRSDVRLDADRVGLRKKKDSGEKNAKECAHGKPG